MASFNQLAHGDSIQIPLESGSRKDFKVYIGDALLRGNQQTIWLKTEEDGKNIYVRKLPRKPLSIGIALFETPAELETTLNSGSYYIA